MTDQDPNPEAPKSDPAAILWSLLAAAMLLIGIATINHNWPIMSDPEDRAANYLMTLGAAQLAYQDLNLDKNYGSFLNLQKSGLLQASEDSTSEKATFDLQLTYWLIPQTSGCWGDSTFTAVALPRNKRLRTFALCDDLTLRIYDGRDDVIPCRWPPLDPELTQALIARRKDKP